jgi:hypothetical protein
VIEQHAKAGTIERGIHPNFLEGSSQGNSFLEVAETCMALAPEAIGFRSHRLFDVTDITHLMQCRFGMKYVSNLGTQMARRIRPILHESGLVHYPIFFEDGTQLFNKLDLQLAPYREWFDEPGLKVFTLHPMNYVFNSPDLAFMRGIKDRLTREEFGAITRQYAMAERNTGLGIATMINEIIEHVLRRNRTVMSLNDLYFTTIQQ